MGRSTNRVGHGIVAAALGLVIGLFADGIGFQQTLSTVPSSTAQVNAASSAQGPLSSAPQGDAVELASMSEEPSALADPTAPESALESLEQRFETIAHRVAPSVVAISAAIEAVESDELLRTEELNTQKLQSALDRGTRMVGTGFIIDADGYILTNEHVIGEASHLWVTTDDHRVYPAIVIGSDPRGDLAVIKIPASNLPTARFASYGSVTRGQWAIALGNPYGLAGDGEMCMSVGVVSATDRSLPKLSSKENRLYSNLIQTTAEINPGNSGGPLFNLNGDVIGVNTAVILPQKSTNGIGFAVPITPGLIAHVQQLKEGREVVYAYLGVTVSTLTDKARKSLGLSAELGGARIDSIEKDSPADSSPLRVNDVVVEVNGELVRDGDHFIRLVGASSVDQPNRMSLYRNGKPKSVDVSMRKRQVPSVAVTRQSQRIHWRGMLLGPVPEHWNGGGETQVGGGLLVLTIDSDSPMHRQGVKPGSVIQSVAGQRVSTVAQLQRIINDVDPSQWTIDLSDDRAVAQGQVVSVE